MDILEDVAQEIQASMEKINEARDTAYERSRRVIGVCAKTIRAIHREDWEKADMLLQQVKEAKDALVADVADFPMLYFAGYTQDAVKEYVEANLTYALVRDLPLPTPQELGAESNTWLNGLAEAATELRRRILDIIRHGHNDEAERLLEQMDQIYSILVTFDFSDSITGGLRRRTDVVRSVLERTRGDMTNSLRQTKLEEALAALEKKLS